MKRVFILIFCALFANIAGATTAKQPPLSNEQAQDQLQKQAQAQGQGQKQSQTGYVEGSAEAAAAASNEGLDNSTDLEFSSENTSTNIVLVPNNNTEGCLRVIGLSFGTRHGAGGLGWPYRSKKCDFEQAADDAFAAGERELGWFWKCQNPNLYKSFKDRGEDDEQASKDCLVNMTKGVTATAMIRDLQDQVAALETQREEDMLEYQRNLELSDEACDERTNRAVTACRK